MEADEGEVRGPSLYSFALLVYPVTDWPSGVQHYYLELLETTQRQGRLTGFYYKARTQRYCNSAMLKLLFICIAANRINL